MKKLHISTGNGKLGMIPNVSLPPVLSCLNCTHCEERCYALKAWRMYKQVRKAWSENFRLAVMDPDRFFHGIESWIQSRRNQPKYFRFHTAGDIPNQTYLDGMIYTASLFPDTKFLCFTKCFKLNYSARPGNLAIVFSMFPGMSKPRKRQGIPFAWVQDGTEKRIPETAIQCSGSCSDCGMCWGLDKLKHDVWFHIH